MARWAPVYRIIPEPVHPLDNMHRIHGLESFRIVRVFLKPALRFHRIDMACRVPLLPQEVVVMLSPVLVRCHIDMLARRLIEISPSSALWFQLCSRPHELGADMVVVLWVFLGSQLLQLKRRRLSPEIAHHCIVAGGCWAP